MNTNRLNTVLVIGLIVGVFNITYANKWRVNNAFGIDADFTNMTDAINTAVSGDTIYVEPSAINYGAIEINKPLYIIGNGYFLDENPGQQANISNSKFTDVTFNSGSEGSVFQGCYIDQGRVNISASNITFQRNRIIYEYAGSNIVRSALVVGDGIGNIIIQQNFIYCDNYYSTGEKALSVSESSNVIVRNNILKSKLYPIYISNSTCIVENNVFDGRNAFVNDSEVRNNIHIASTEFSNYNPVTYFTNCVVEYNISTNTAYGTDNGNQGNISVESLLNTIGSADNFYRLKVNSPAENAGVGGVDCGAYGGNHAYKLSGLANVPAIYEYAHSVNNNTQQLDVTFSVKSHN